MTIYSGLNEPLNNSTGWDVPLNNNFTIVDGYLTQTASVAITTSDVTLTAPTSTPNTSTLGQLQSMLILLTGILTGNRNLIIPSGNRGRWIIRNTTTNGSGGPYTVTVKTSVAGATIDAPQGYSITVFCDGTNVYLADDGLTQAGGSSTFSTVTATDGFVGRQKPRVVTGSTSGATQTPDADTTDQYEINGLATNTTFAIPDGTPVDGQKLMIRIISDATGGYTLTWNAIYREVGTTLPSGVVASKATYVGCIYNDAASKWDVVAIAAQA